jgi:hypothetical protein
VKLSESRGKSLKGLLQLPTSNSQLPNFSSQLPNGRDASASRMLAFMPGLPRLVRENAFLVAAVALPLIVVGFFLVASAIPRWSVPAPAYDLLLQASSYSDQNRARVVVDFRVRDGRVQAVVRPLPPSNTYVPPLPKLYVFDHTTQSVREIPFDVPDVGENDQPVTVPVPALARHRVMTDARAPDGYELQSRTRHGGGIVGDLFGMRSYDDRVALVKGARVVPIELPARQYGYSPSAVGWIVEDGQGVGEPAR